MIHDDDDNDDDDDDDDNVNATIEGALIASYVDPTDDS